MPNGPENQVAIATASPHIAAETTMRPEDGMSALLLERHEWETSGSAHQIQVPKAAFEHFFGAPRSVNVRVWVPPTAGTYQSRSVLLSYYGQSDTYRFNWLMEFGSLGHAVIVFGETGDRDSPYDVWWFLGADANTVLSRPYPWQQAKASQYGDGRFWAIIPSPASRQP